ncbi:CPBP family intramembrane metalloprotease [Saccharopolyspora halophila]|uniref:CPBP family intramembrane metalloprotease n=2 Tax=Saccharopolyspora halophila TaxID=405551 RepID=A0ABN3GXJ4_9PSEU
MPLQREPAIAAGTPYHLLARTPAHRWWRPLVGVLLVTALSVLFAVLLYGAALGFAAVVGARTDPELGFADPLWMFVVGFVTVAGLLPAVLLTARIVQRRPAGTLSSVQGRLRWRWMLECARWAVLCQVLVLAVGLVRGDQWAGATWPGWRTYLTVLALAVLVVPFQAAAEEYLFRGWFLQAFASWIRTPWPGAVVASIMFVALHDYSDPLVIVDLFVFAMALCWLSIRTGGLEAAVALHVVNNVASAAFEATRGVPNLDQSGAYSLWEVLPTIAVTLAYAWWIDRRAARSGIATTTA